jgi:hypothetical protein
LKPRYAAQRDANHSQVRDGLRDCGFEAEDIGGLGGGIGDILCRHRGTGRVRFFEVKDGTKSASRKKLTPAEKRMQALLGDLYVVVETLQEAVRAMTG